MSSDGPSKTKKEKKETNTIIPKTVIAIKIYVRSMFFIISFYGNRVVVAGFLFVNHNYIFCLDFKSAFLFSSFSFNSFLKFA